MRKELCFRVCTENNIGLYGANVNWPSSQSDFKTHMHPCPTEDMGMCDAWALKGYSENKDYLNYYFGFKSMEQLRMWLFDAEYLQHLKDNKIKIHIYQTDDYIIGDTQMVFRLSTATLIGKADLI